DLSDRHITVTASDGIDTSNVATTTISLTNGANADPVATADANLVVEDVILSATGNVLTNDSDGDANVVQTLTVSEVNGSAANVGQDVVTAAGTFHIDSDGHYTFALNNDFVQVIGQGSTATTSITYQVSDGAGGFASSQLTITIHGTNDGPVAT